MKKYLAIILSMVCVMNLMACSGQKTEPVSESDGMISEAEIEAIFGDSKQEEETGEKTEPKKETSIAQERADGS